MLKSYAEMSFQLSYTWSDSKKPTSFFKKKQFLAKNVFEEVLR